MTKFSHKIVFFIGLMALIYSVISAVLFNNSHFYTLFAVGSFFVLDFIDYRINKTSITSYFINSKHHDAFILFFICATACCFIVDFVFGVHIAKMWIWRDYKPIHFVIMFLFMNASYVLGMYELFRVINSLLKKRISDRYVFQYKVNINKHNMYALIGLIVGIMCFIIPLYPLLMNKSYLIEFIMIFPFLGMIIISDSITLHFGGKPFIIEIINLNILLVVSIFITVMFASIITEIINLPAQEWEYLKMPFSYYKIFTVPIAVFIGWFPLVISSLAMVNMIKRVDYIRDRR